MSEITTAFSNCPHGIMVLIPDSRFNCTRCGSVMAAKGEMVVTAPIEVSCDHCGETFVLGLDFVFYEKTTIRSNRESLVLLVEEEKERLEEVQKTS